MVHLPVLILASIATILEAACNEHGWMSVGMLLMHWKTWAMCDKWAYMAVDPSVIIRVLTEQSEH